METGSRNLVIDLVKGLAIILMVLGHTGFIYTRAIYLFHMPVFFLASGYLFQTSACRTVSDLKSLCRKRFFSLYLPCLLWNVAFVLLHNFFFSIGLEAEPLPGTAAGHWPLWFPPVMDADFWIITAKTCCLFLYSEPLAIVSWFFRALLLANIGFAVIHYLSLRLCPKYPLILSLGVSLSLLFASFHDHAALETYGVGAALSSLIFFPLGILLRKAHLPQTFRGASAALLAGMSALLLLNPHGDVTLSHNEFTHPFFLIATALGGWYFLWGAGVLCSRRGRLASWISYLARHSIPILFLHLLCMKVTALLWVHVSGMPVSAWNDLSSEKWWWTVSFPVGLVAPLLLLISWNALVQGCRRLLSLRSSNVVEPSTPKQ